MHTQTRILETLRAPATQGPLDDILTDWSGPRTRLGEAVCAAFGFVDAAGRNQVTGCVKALRQLAREGRLTLPVRQPCAARSTPVCLAEPVAEPVEVPDTVGAVQGLCLVRVDHAALRRLWNTLIAGNIPGGRPPLWALRCAI